MTPNLASLVTEAATRNPSAPAFISADRTVTWSELERLVRAVAGGLAARGLSRGDRVALVISNSIEFVSSYFGVLRAGLIAVPVNTTYTPYETGYLIEQSGAALVLCDRVREEAVQEAAHDVPVIVVGSAAWRSLTIGSTPPPDVEVGPEDVAVLMFTSGTSGRPKGAMLTHQSLLANLDQLSAVPAPQVMRSDDVVLVLLPLFHIYALNAVLGMLARTGAAAVLSGRFDPQEALRLVRRWGVTVVASAPPVYQAWSRVPELSSALADVRMLVSGAAPLTSEVFEAFTAAAGQPLWEGYGMTEASPVIASTVVSGQARAGSVGRPLPGVQIRLCDELGHEVEDGDLGEIWVKGENLFVGYWPDGADGPDEEGWWPTGDLGFLDPDGQLRLVDRRNDLIIVSGFNVYPREVEEVLVKVPGIREVAVMGEPHESTGETVKALVVVRPDADLDADAVRSAAREKLARFKCPTIVEFVPALPHSGTGKVSKGALRERIEGVRE